MKEFDESKVNRDKMGRFATGGTKEYRQNTKYEEILRVSPQEKPKPKTQAEFFGVAYTGVKGKDAVDKLLKERQGHVKAAFHRKEIGDIDLVWGDEKGGLAHVIQRRDYMRSIGTGNISGVDMVKKIPDIVENGEFGVDALGRISIAHEKYKVAVNLNFDGAKLNWIVSAMEIIKK